MDSINFKKYFHTKDDTDFCLLQMIVRINQEKSWGQKHTINKVLQSSVIVLIYNSGNRWNQYMKVYTTFGRSL